MAFHCIVRAFVTLTFSALFVFPLIFLPFPFLTTTIIHPLAAPSTAPPIFAPQQQHSWSLSDSAQNYFMMLGSKTGWGSEWLAKMMKIILGFDRPGMTRSRRKWQQDHDESHFATLFFIRSLIFWRWSWPQTETNDCCYSQRILGVAFLLYYVFLPMKTEEHQQQKLCPWFIVPPPKNILVFQSWMNNRKNKKVSHTQVKTAQYHIRWEESLVWISITASLRFVSSFILLARSCMQSDLAVKGSFLMSNICGTQYMYIYTR